MSSRAGFALSILLLMLGTGLAYQLDCEKGWYGRRARLAFKGLTTAFAGLLALYAYAVGGQPAALLMAVGIFVCALADILLELRFKAGMFTFALGHLAFCASFLMRQPPGLCSLALFLLLLAFVSVTAYRIRGRVAFGVLPFYAYALIISLMLSLAAAQPWPVFAGAALFVVSDAIIARRLVYPERNPWDRACILLYYLAQFLLAATLLL